jgi:hypothetical protein
MTGLTGAWALSRRAAVHEQQQLGSATKRTQLISRSPAAPARSEFTWTPRGLASQPWPQQQVGDDTELEPLQAARALGPLPTAGGPRAPTSHPCRGLARL